jgi:hypothetical protein
MQRHRLRQASPLDQRLTEQAQRLHRAAEGKRPVANANGLFSEPGSLR